MNILDQQYSISYGGLLILAFLYIVQLIVQKWTGKKVHGNLDTFRIMSEFLVETVNQTFLKWWVVLRPGEKVPDFSSTLPNPLQSQMKEMHSIMKTVVTDIAELRHSFLDLFGGLEDRIDRHHPESKKHRLQ